MLDGDNGTLRRVAWSEIFPWLSIFRTFRLAISLRVLLLAAVALLLTATGWALFGWMFSGDPAAARVTQWTKPVPALPLDGGYQRRTRPAESARHGANRQKPADPPRGLPGSGPAVRVVGPIEPAALGGFRPAGQRVGAGVPGALRAVVVGDLGVFRRGDHAYRRGRTGLRGARRLGCRPSLCLLASGSPIAGLPCCR